jgi:hypothetical protein
MPLPPPRRPSLSLDSLSFETSRYTSRGDMYGTRVWYTPDGDGIGLYYFPRRPDLPESLASIGSLREFYRQGMAGTDMRVVDCAILPIGGASAIWMIGRAADPQTRTSIYLGSITIPFTEFSFVIKMQAAERGPSGMRDALLTEKALGDGSAQLEGGRIVFRGPLPDHEQFDSMFPDHPVSRLRRELREVASTVRLDPQVLASSPFPLPTA